MFKQTLLGLTCAAALCSIGCGGSDGTDGGTDGGSTAGADMTVAHLQDGTYAVSNIVKITDDCGLILEGDSASMTNPLASLQVLNTGQVLSIGKKYDSTTDPKWVPADYGEGSGMYTDATHATLKVNSTATLADNCTYQLMRTTVATFTGNNALSVDFTDSESNETSCMASNGDQTTACTSHYTFDMKRTGP